MFLGPVLTNEKNIERLIEYRNKGMFDSIKVVTGWGLDTGWNSITRAQLLTLTPNPIVRTTVGDPSNRTQDPFLNPDKVEAELAPWIQYKPDLMVELGNEPNIGEWSNEAIWAYRYFLDLSIKRIRDKFPLVHIIAPALIVNDNMNTWLEILNMGGVMMSADSIGVHAYEHYGFIGTTLPARTNQLQIVNAVYQRRFPNKPLVLTEFGINHPPMTKEEKLKFYRSLMPELPKIYIGATFYHLNRKGDIDPQYNIPLEAV